MANDVLGAGGMTVENRTFYEKQLLTRAVPMMLHTGWGLQKDIPNNMGNSIQFRRFARPAAATTALTEGTAGASTAMTVAAVTVTVLQYGAYDRVSDVLLSQGIDDVMAGLSGAFGEQMGVTIDCLARNTITAGTNNFFISGGSAGGITQGAGNFMSATVLKRAARELQAANARPLAKAGGNYVAFIHPDVWSDLFDDTLIQNALQYGGLRGDTNPLFSGSIFDYAGIRLQRTSNARVDGTAGLSNATSVGKPGVFYTAVIGEEAYGEIKFGSDNVRLIVNNVGSAGAADPLHQFGTVGWKASYGMTILNQSFVYVLVTAANSGTLRQAGNATP